MGEIVNLKRARKRLAREETAKAADANRGAHGRTKADRHAEAARRALAERTLDAKRLDDQ